MPSEAGRESDTKAAKRHKVKKKHNTQVELNDCEAKTVRLASHGVSNQGVSHQHRPEAALKHSKEQE